MFGGGGGGFSSSAPRQSGGGVGGEQEKVVVPRTFKLLEELEAGEKGTGVNSHHCSLGLADDGEKSIIFLCCCFYSRSRRCVYVLETSFSSSSFSRRFLRIAASFRFREKRDLSFSSPYCFWYSISELTR